MTADELRQAIRALPPLPDSAPPFTWLGRRNDIRRQILKPGNDLSRFLEWSTIAATMNTDPDRQNYHLDQWEQCTGLSVASLGSVVEFGGGYGAMALKLWERGFAGQYYCYDFPEFIALQKFYTGLEILTDLPSRCDLLIAICSLSEADLETRQTFLAGLEFDYCLIRYQYDWWGIDNHEWFKRIEGKRWYDQQDANHWYLVRQKGYYAILS